MILLDTFSCSCTRGLLRTVTNALTEAVAPTSLVLIVLTGFHKRSFSPDSEAMGFLLQITMSCPCALSRQVAGAGAVSLHVWRQVAGAGAGCRVPVLVL